MAVSDAISRRAAYGLAATSYLAATLATVVWWRPLFEQVPFALYFAAIATTAWFGGFWPGVAASLAGAVTTTYLMASSSGHVPVLPPAILCAVAIFICYLSERRARAQRGLGVMSVALETDRGRLETILRQMPAGVVIASAPDGELTLANDRVSEILRHPFRPAASIAEYAEYSGFHPDGRPYAPEDYPLARSLRLGEEILNEEIEYLCGDGVRRLLIVSSGPIRDRANRIVAALAVFSDITEQRQHERQARHSQRLEAIGRLAGGVAHDFNNLLTAILGFGDMAQRALPPTDPVRSYLDEITKCADRAADLTRQLLAFSRRQILQPTVLDLNTVVQDLTALLGRLIGEDVRLQVKLGRDLGRVKADRGQIEQVLTNLALNSRDAMPTGGTLSIETSNVDLDDNYAQQHVSVKAGPYVMVANSDTGVGMDQETQARIFEPFFTTKRTGEGTGLGLATVYGIVKQSGGHIWVYSEPSRGTIFKVYFPRVFQDEDARAPRVPPLVAGQPVSETILLVEDDAAVRSLSRRVLTEAGYTVLECNSGGEAEWMSSSFGGRIHLLLTDVVMPGLSGRELAERLITARPDLRVLYMSGYTDNAIVHHGVLDAGVALLEKPFTPAVLLERVRVTLDDGTRRS